MPWDCVGDRGTRCSAQASTGLIDDATIHGHFAASSLGDRFAPESALDGLEREVYFEQVAVPGPEPAFDFTDASSLGVTFRRAPFPHLLFEWVLSYSQWTYVGLAPSDTVEALVAGLQGARWTLGAVPPVFRHDYLSAATHELKRSGGRQSDGAPGRPVPGRPGAEEGELFAVRRCEPAHAITLSVVARGQGVASARLRVAKCKHPDQVVRDAQAALYLALGDQDVPHEHAGEPESFGCEPRSLQSRPHTHDLERVPEDRAGEGLGRRPKKGLSSPAERTGVLNEDRSGHLLQDGRRFGHCRDHFWSREAGLGIKGHELLGVRTTGYDASDLGKEATIRHDVETPRPRVLRRRSRETAIDNLPQHLERHGICEESLAKAATA